jgi:hypothetical protein
VMAKKVPILVGLVLELHHEDSYILGSRLSGHSSKELKCVPICNE